MSTTYAAADPATVTTMALISQHELAILRRNYADALAAAVLWQNKHADAQAEAAAWRQRVFDTRELIDLVADLADDPTLATLAALTNYFQMWRSLVEAGIPVTWAEPTPEPDGALDDVPW